MTLLDIRVAGRVLFLSCLDIGLRDESVLVLDFITPVVETGG